MICMGGTSPQSAGGHTAEAPVGSGGVPTKAQSSLADQERFSSYSLRPHQQQQVLWEAHSGVTRGKLRGHRAASKAAARQEVLAAERALAGGRRVEGRGSWP